MRDYKAKHIPVVSMLMTITTYVASYCKKKNLWVLHIPQNL